MILLDTNVISELMRTEPEPSVVAWVDAQAADQVFISAITVAELFYGVMRLPDGQRKRELAGLVAAAVDEDFSGRVVAFDDVAARHYAHIVVARERSGRAISMADAQIAAVCRSHSATVATRNVDDFADTGIRVVNPWERPAST